MKIQFNFESPYTPDGQPRQDLPKCEVLATDGKEWIVGFFAVFDPTYNLVVQSQTKETLFNPQWFAPLPTIYNDGTETL